ncbi:MAG: hypothetical protein KTR20_14445, partial [Cellvibrionaceae bacterium]|nr:hypothetical protein [Cellvibrionaceae bacterium]
MHIVDARRARHKDVASTMRRFADIFTSRIGLSTNGRTSVCGTSTRKMRLDFSFRSKKIVYLTESVFKSIDCAFFR